MVEIKKDKRDILRPLFASYTDTTVYSCLEGRNSSRAWADSETAPTAAVVFLGGFRKGSGGFAFLAGDKSCPCIKELIRAYPEDYEGNGRIIVPPDISWKSVIEDAVGHELKDNMRYSLSKSEHHFDRAQLKAWAHSLPDGFELRFVDRELFGMLESCPWSPESVGNFVSYDEFEKDNAMGVACLHKGEIVGVVGSFSAYNGGIEIEIDTKEEYRKRGIARAGASMLIDACLERGLYPSWDAATKISLALAQSLGYVPTGEYVSYWLGREVR